MGLILIYILIISTYALLTTAKRTTESSTRKEPKDYPQPVSCLGVLSVCYVLTLV